MRWRTWLWSVLPGAVPLLLAGGHAAAHTVAIAEIEVRTFAFSPDSLAAGPGTTIRWTNRDAIEHTITWGSPDERDVRIAPASLDSAGAIHTATLRDPGRYHYFCDRHRFMRGVVIVTSPGERTDD